MESKQSVMKNKSSYSVPEGYFEDLQRRLSDIPAREPRRTAVRRLTPYLALAASFALIVAVGTAVLRKTVPPVASEQEIIEYLIDSDMTLAQIIDYLP